MSDFSDQYRVLVKDVARDIVIARAKSHEAISKVLIDAPKRSLDLCRFALGLRAQSEVDISWFGEIIKSDDDVFNIAIDTAEAMRMASLALRARIEAGDLYVSGIVSTASAVGRRKSIEGLNLEKSANEQMSKAASTPNLSNATLSIAPLEPAELTETLQTIVESFTGENVRTSMDAIISDYDKSFSDLHEQANAAIGQLSAQLRAVALETNILWWHLGAYSDFVDKPLDQLPSNILPLVIGIEIGNLLQNYPGTNGVYSRSGTRDRTSKVDNTWI